MENEQLAIVETLVAFPVIATEDQYREAGELYKAGQAALKEIDLRHQDDIDFAHREHKRLIAVRDAVKKPVEEAVRRIKGHMNVYRDEQERAARAERARIITEARKREEERKLAEALAVEASGNQAAADAIMQEEIMLPPVSIPAPVPKVEGVVFRTAWKFEVTDPAAVPREYLAVDEIKIGKVVRASGGTITIPGVKVWWIKV
jgi:hypothetical protein